MGYMNNDGDLRGISNRQLSAADRCKFDTSIDHLFSAINKERGCDRSGQLQEIRRNLRKLLLKFL